MQITDEWLESVQDSNGLTRGQQQLLTIWADKLAYVGFGYLPDNVALFIEGCKGWRKTPAEIQAMRQNNQR